MNKTGEVWTAQIKCFKIGSISALSDKRFKSYAHLNINYIAKHDKKIIIFHFNIEFLAFLFRYKNLNGMVRKAQIMCFKIGSILAFSDKWFRSYAFLKVGCLAKNSFKNHGS